MPFLFLQLKHHIQLLQKLLRQVELVVTDLSLLLMCSSRLLVELSMHPFMMYGMPVTGQMFEVLLVHVSRTLHRVSRIHCCSLSMPTSATIPVLTATGVISIHLQATSIENVHYVWKRQSSNITFVSQDCTFI